MDATGLQEYMLPCINKKVFGIDCLGCGMQRATALLFQGDFVRAFYIYPAIYPILLLIVFIILNFFVKVKYAFQIKIGLVIFIAVVVMVSYFIKMSSFM